MAVDALLGCSDHLGLYRRTGSQAGDSTIYVSPAGNDAWSGTLAEPDAQKNDGPVATPEKARDLVRIMKSKQGDKPGPIYVYLRGGTYFLDRPLVLAPEDSGVQRGPIVWAAYENEHPILSGGRRITGWTKTTVNGREAWVAKMPDWPDQVAFRELWLDGKRLPRARWPKKGTLR